MADDIPPEILAEIKRVAREEWPEDWDMQQYTIDAETTARVDDLEPEALITGHYKFGANELSIHRALVRIVDMLKSDYGLQIPADEVLR